jgi:hypothetical protein
MAWRGVSNQWHSSYAQLERRVKKALPRREHNDFIFTEVDGVTVRIGRNGGIDIPAIRTYLTHPLEAANGRQTFS